jgi:hypothetical protein
VEVVSLREVHEHDQGKELQSKKVQQRCAEEGHQRDPEERTGVRHGNYHTDFTPTSLILP